MCIRDSAKVALDAGTRDVALAFFGKVLADQHAQGPFHLGQLSGARFDPGHEPDLEQMPPFAGTFTTAPYPDGAFSDAAYDSPEKQRMIEFLTEQKERGVHQGLSLIHISEPTRLLSISYAVFCLKKK